MIYNYSENTGINFKLYMIFDIINWLLSLFFLHFDLSTIRNRGKKIYNKIGFNFSILFRPVSIFFFLFLHEGEGGAKDVAAATRFRFDVAI